MNYSYHKILKGYVVELILNSQLCVNCYGRNLREATDEAVKVYKLYVLASKSGIIPIIRY